MAMITAGCWRRWRLQCDTTGSPGEKRVWCCGGDGCGAFTGDDSSSNTDRHESSKSTLWIGTLRLWVLGSASASVTFLKGSGETCLDCNARSESIRWAVAMFRRCERGLESLGELAAARKGSSNVGGMSLVQLWAKGEGLQSSLEARGTNCCTGRISIQLNREK
jgi:hypothetical protein